MFLFFMAAAERGDSCAAGEGEIQYTFKNHPVGMLSKGHLNVQCCHDASFARLCKGPKRRSAAAPWAVHLSTQRR